MSEVDVKGESVADESPFLLHIWEVDPAQDGIAVQRLDGMLRQLTSDPGFVHARVLESLDGQSISTIVEMRTVEDRQRIEQLPLVREPLGHLDGTANLIVKLYHQIAVY